MWIVSSDTVLANAIQIALRQAGMEATVLTALPSPAKEPRDGWIIDLDSLPSAAKLPMLSITFARAPHPRVDLVRPFLFREMIALVQKRFHTTLRESVSHPSPQSRPEEPFLELLPGGVLLQGKHIPLSPSEHALLSLLLEHPGECVPIHQLDALWQGSGNTTAVYIRYLRQKLDEPTGLRLIRSVRGRGYCLCLPI